MFVVLQRNPELSETEILKIVLSLEIKKTVATQGAPLGGQVAHDGSPTPSCARTSACIVWSHRYDTHRSRRSHSFLSVPSTFQPETWATSPDPTFSSSTGIGSNAVSPWLPGRALPSSAHAMFLTIAPSTASKVRFGWNGKGEVGRGRWMGTAEDSMVHSGHARGASHVPRSMFSFVNAQRRRQRAQNEWPQWVPLRE